MALFKPFKRIDHFYLSLLKVYKSVKEYRFSKKHKITYLSSNRSVDLRTAKLAPKLEKQTLKLFKEQIQAFFYRKILEIRLHTPEKIPLQPAGVTGW